MWEEDSLIILNVSFSSCEILGMNRSNEYKYAIIFEHDDREPVLIGDIPWECL